MEEKEKKGEMEKKKEANLFNLAAQKWGEAHYMNMICVPIMKASP